MLDSREMAESRESGKPTAGAMPLGIAKSLGLLKTGDLSAVKKACEEAIKENNKAVLDYRGGNAKSLHFLVGKVMQKTKGTADATEAEKILREMMA
jgi:aspartyl-tRNA(Asn)/glutamyl-tRNA(Gln) amidotransferase subunit B